MGFQENLKEQLRDGRSLQNANTTLSAHSPGYLDKTHTYKALGFPGSSGPHPLCNRTMKASCQANNRDPGTGQSVLVWIKFLESRVRAYSQRAVCLLSPHCQ